MMKRRYFIFGFISITLIPFLSGCSNNKVLIEVMVLQNSIPGRLLKRFEEEFKGDFKDESLVFKPTNQLQALFDLLLKLQNKFETNNVDNNEGFKLPKLEFPQINLFANQNQKSLPPGLVTLGDYWLAKAIGENLIQPMKVDNLSGWQGLPLNYRNLVRRDAQGNLDNSGGVWGAPYRWGCVMIAYRSDKFKSLGWFPQDWSDLWRDDLRGRISLFAQPREIIGFILKKLGYSYNIEDLSTVSNLKSELEAFHSQVKLYDSLNYLQPLIIGDTWVAIGWSSDILPILERYPNVKAVIPISGTSLWADLWVKPFSDSVSGNGSVDDSNSNFAPDSNANTDSVSENLPESLSESHSAALDKWIDFCWQEKSAISITRFTSAASPIILNMDDSKLPQGMKKNSLLNPSNDVLANSEFLLPLSSEVLQQYSDLWQSLG